MQQISRVGGWQALACLNTFVQDISQSAQVKQIASQKFFSQMGDQHIYVDDRKKRSTECNFPKTRNRFEIPLNYLGNQLTHLQKDQPAVASVRYTARPRPATLQKKKLQSTVLKN